MSDGQFWSLILLLVCVIALLLSILVSCVKLNKQIKNSNKKQPQATYKEKKVNNYVSNL